MEISSALLRKMVIHLDHCCAKKEWQQLRKLDLQIRTVLDTLNSQPELANRLQADLVNLRRHHEVAIERCDEEKKRIGITLARLQNQREGIEGYSQVERGMA